MIYCAIYRRADVIRGQRRHAGPTWQRLGWRSAVDWVHGPGKEAAHHVALTWRTRGGHKARHVGGQTDGSGRSDGGGERAAGAHGRLKPARRPWRTATLPRGGGGRRRRPMASGGGATARATLAAAKRLGGGAATKWCGRERGRGGGISPTVIDDGERRRAMTATGHAPEPPSEHDQRG